MSRSKKTAADDEAWGYHGKPPGEWKRTPEQFAELARTTKLRTLLDMSEREIRALEQLYGCRVIRVQKPPGKRVRRATNGPGVRA